MSVPFYPSTDDIGYAVWLKNFAAQLPALADQYQLSEEEVASVPRLAAEFTAWLICRMHRATQVIQHQQNPGAAQESDRADLPVPAIPFLLDRVAALVQHIRTHPTYRPADGGVLGLAGLSPAAGAPPLPMPRLRAAPPVVGAVPVLTWANRRNATIQLEVCRDGATWLPLQPAVAKRYEDNCPQPAHSAHWLYRARYRWPDWPAGKWARVVAVPVGPAR